MDESGYVPAPQPHPQYTTPVAPGPVPLPPLVAPAPKPRSPWRWVALFAVVLLLLGCCGLPMLAAFRYMIGGSATSLTSDSIALIHIDDTIAGTGTLATPESFADQFGAAEDDDAVKAIVLRIDSPGGTVAASQEIASYVAASEKPVVVSVGDICASGAYMVASQADQIVAMPGSSVGSIGVIMQIPNLEGLMDKLGVDFQVLIAGERKDEGSPYRALTPEEIAAFQGDLDTIHTQFIDLVAEGRGLPSADVRALATGETYLGSRAVDLGLIDEIGTLDDTYEVAADLGGIEGTYDVVSFDAPVDLISNIFSSMFGLASSLPGSYVLDRPAAALK